MLPILHKVFQGLKSYLKLENRRVLAIITEIDGKVSIKETKNKKEIVVKSKDDARTYTIPFGAKIKVKDGDMVEAGDALIEGSINPAEILAIKGPEGVYELLNCRSSKSL